MNICLESNLPPSSSVEICSIPPAPDESSATVGIPQVSTPNIAPHGVSTIHVPAPPIRASSSTPTTTTKLVVANHASANSILQKVVNPPLITVFNSTGPLTVVKTMVVTTGSSSSPQFTVVNSTPLTVTNTAGVKPPTITLLNAPLTVVKAIAAPTGTSLQEKGSGDGQCVIGGVAGRASIPTIIENRTHNVFVKNTTSDQEVPQSHKLLTANNFPPGNLLNITQPSAKLTGQRNKIKMVSNVVTSIPSQGSSTVVINKPNITTQRYIPRSKMCVPPNGANATTTKYLNKLTLNHPVKLNVPKTDKSPIKVAYPIPKGHIKTAPPASNLVQNKSQGIRTIPPQPKPIPGQVQRTSSGLRTIPPQKAPKVANKPNYIGKHAIQAQKVKNAHPKLKSVKSFHQPYNNYLSAPPPMPEKQLTLNQALTAEILETLGNKSNGNSSNTYSYKSYDVMPSRYENPYMYDNKPVLLTEPVPKVEDRNTGLDALSLICQAVLLDHNYNATLPPESPTRSVPPVSPKVNGVPSGPLFSPGGKRRTLSSSNTISVSSSLTSIVGPPLPSNSTSGTVQDDDAASDVSYGSDRKHDTEGEETDTAPEAELVNSSGDPYDHYGDYVTRCICGFLHDDGYMIECDRCKVWQHVQCVIKNKQVPDEFLCEICNPTKQVDCQKARLVQQQWLRDRQFLDLRKGKESKLKEFPKHCEAMSDSDSSDQEQPPGNCNVVNKGRTPMQRRKTDLHQKQTAKQRHESAKESGPGPRKQIKRRERKVIKRKIIKRKPKNTVKHEEEKFDVVTTPIIQLPQLRQWIDNYEEAVTNHYSPELRARISSIRVNGVHSEFPVEFDSSVNKCRVNTQPLTEMKYLVATVQLPSETPVVELRGKYMLSTQHRNAGCSSLTTRQHAQRPGPFLFFYRLIKDNTEVCVDTRTYGNSARFIRRSCKPNAELRHCIEKGVLHLYIVTLMTVEKNMELTIKHESHDLAAVGTTHIACACGNTSECTVNRMASPKKNGENIEVQRKRRGRRTTSTSATPVKETVKETVEQPPPKPRDLTPPPSPIVVQSTPPAVQPDPVVEEPVEIKEEPEPVEVKVEVEEPKIVVKQDIEEDLKEIKQEMKACEEEKEKPKPEPEVVVKEEEVEEPPKVQPSISTRRSSHKSDREEPKENPQPPKKEDKSKNKKLSREERKLEAILRAIEQMEKADQRKQEHQAKQAHRRESEPGPNIKEEDKEKPAESKPKRRRRKGRSRTMSNTQTNRRNRVNSTDSYLTSGDESLLSPNENGPVTRSSVKESTSENGKDSTLLMNLLNKENGNRGKSPVRDDSNNSDSAHSSPETHVSSACLLVQAAVEPLEPGFKFPKTKKGMMNEWLNKVPEPIHSASAISPSSLQPHINSGDFDPNTAFYSPNKNLCGLSQSGNFVEANGSARGSAKKRWLRQAISEDQCDSPTNRPESPPISDMVAPPKKRRLPRESLSSEKDITSTSSIQESGHKLEGSVEIIYSGTEGDSPTQSLESDAVLKERAAEMKQEFSTCLLPGTAALQDHQPHTAFIGLMDPRLTRDQNHQMFSNSEHLVGTVEKTLSILGFEDRKVDPVPPAKRKLSINEYRQRKKLNDNSDKIGDEQSMIEENSSSESFKQTRRRSDSTSSTTSLSSSDDETLAEVISKKAPVFNSEPTELERQREISRLRLKKAFGLSVEDEPYKSTLDVKAIINCELPAVVKPTVPLSSPTFPIPGSLIPGVINSPKSAISESTSQDSPIKTNSSITENKPSAESSVLEQTSPISDGEMSPLMASAVEEDKEMVVPENEVKLTRTPPVVEEVVSANVLQGAALSEPPSEVRGVGEVVEERTQVTVESELPKEAVGGEKMEGEVKQNLFYLLDEEETHAGDREASESVSYVPPFNNPVYPTNAMSTYTSIIDDDSRYEARNPSPPPLLDSNRDFPNL